MFETLEEIQAHCDREYVTNGPVRIDESQISQRQKPPEKTYILKMSILPPLSGMDQAKQLHKLKVEIENDGFSVDVDAGKVRGSGYHIELIVRDKHQPQFSPGEEVLFRGDPAGAPQKYRIKDYKWNPTLKGFEYGIISSADHRKGFRTVPASALTKI